jgi:hypothetical protein
LEHRASNPVSVKNLTAIETSIIVKLLRPYVPVGTKRPRRRRKRREVVVVVATIANLKPMVRHAICQKCMWMTPQIPVAGDLKVYEVTQNGNKIVAERHSYISC